MRLRKFHAAVLLLFLLISIHAVCTPEAVAPPFGYGYVCGLISEYLNTDVRISCAILNSTINIDSDGENLTYRIGILSRYNLTNTADQEVNSKLAEYVGKHKVKMVGFAIVDPTTDVVTAKSLKNLRDKMGLKGVVLYCSASRFHPAHRPPPSGSGGRRRGSAAG